jgi:predicted Zn-dependent peptidase
MIGATTRARRALGGMLFVLALASAPLVAQDLASFEKRTTLHKLPNGWTFILVQRPGSPVFSFATTVNVGSAQEVPGITGLAHMFEHMAFKGTPVVGTKDYGAEKKALEALEAAYQAWQAERLAPRPDAEKLKKLEADFQARETEAQQFVVSNEFDDLVEREGGVGMNASTSADSTNYFYSLPVNKLELFAYLESERFLRPVFREFYKERAVVMEERRLRTDSSPIGRLVERFLSAAFEAHPYHQPTVGYMSDLESFTMTDAEAFFQTHYTPSNMVTAIVGGIDPKAVIPILDKYFGRIPARPAPPPLRTVEPPQIAEKVVSLEDASQPFYLEGYHKPAATDPDQEVYDALEDILSNGRSGRLYRSLVRDQKIAVQVQSFAGFPGDRYPNLWAVFAVPAPGKTADEVAAALHRELERLKTEDVEDVELERFKTRARAGLLRGLASNTGLARNLAEAQRLRGDWRELFRTLDRIEKVTKEDIRRVAQKTLYDNNRTVAKIVTVEAETAPASGR